MILAFPKFVKLSIEHKTHIEEHTSKHPPYSDFSVTSLISWGDEETYLSLLNGNLVIKFKDYITKESFFTFIGTNKITDTIQTLLQESIKNGLYPRLRLIPEAVVKTDPKILEQFEILEDRDNFDYIYLLEEAQDFKGKKHRDKRNFINRFKKLYHSSYKKLDLSQYSVQKEILNLFESWKKIKGIKGKEIENEFLALKKVLQLAKNLNLIGLGIYINSKMAAFSINEILVGDYAINLFEKADTSYQGIFPYLRNITAIHLLELGKKYLSHEQDLGIENLRKSKMSYNPHFFLKKYTISPKVT